MVFIKSSKNQVWNLPPDIRDLIPSDHICYLIESFVDMTDFTEFEIRYEGSGHPAYHPSIMCKILLQSMLDRVRLSREIARNVRENVVYMYLAENLKPDFRTISDFRKENEILIAELFKNTIKPRFPLTHNEVGGFTPRSWYSCFCFSSISPTRSDLPGCSKHSMTSSLSNRADNV